MIENAANAVKNLENTVIECYSDSQKSDKLSARQQKRLDSLKHKRDKRIEEGMIDKTQEVRKRGLEVTWIGQGDKIIKVTIFDIELWHSCATKSVDSEREKKRHKENS